MSTGKVKIVGNVGRRYGVGRKFAGLGEYLAEDLPGDRVRLFRQDDPGFELSAIEFAQHLATRSIQVIEGDLP